MRSVWCWIVQQSHRPIQRQRMHWSASGCADVRCCRERLLDVTACSSTCSTCSASTGACLGCVAGYSYTAGSLTCNGARNHGFVPENNVLSMRRHDLPINCWRNGYVMRWFVRVSCRFNECAACSITCSSCSASTGACLGCVAGYFFTNGSLTCTGGVLEC